MNLNEAHEIIRCKRVDAPEEEYRRYKNVDFYEAKRFIEGHKAAEEKYKEVVDLVSNLPALLESAHKRGESVADVHDWVVRSCSDALAALHNTERKG